MTILKCDRCKKNVKEFNSKGSALFPEGYQEVCVTCWDVVRLAIDEARDIAKKAEEKEFMRVFKEKVA